jgi:hypothetical protein
MRINNAPFEAGSFIHGHGKIIKFFDPGITLSSKCKIIDLLEKFINALLELFEGLDGGKINDVAALDGLRWRLRWNAYGKVERYGQISFEHQVELVGLTDLRT